MGDRSRRYYVIPADERDIVSVDKPELAARFAVELGDGAHIVDTEAAAYFPMVQRIEDGEAVYLEYGGWDTSIGLDANLIQAAKKGYAPLVRAFLAKGAAAGAADGDGGTALIWAVAGGDGDCVALLIAAGADIDASDADGTTALALAQRKGRTAIAELLTRAGAVV